MDPGITSYSKLQDVCIINKDVCIIIRIKHTGCMYKSDFYNPKYVKLN